MIPRVVRSPLAFLTLALAVLTAGFPCYRCTPAGGGVGATVLVGAHAHGAQRHGCCAEHGCCRDEAPGHDGTEPTAPSDHDDHGPACCEHSSADPSAPTVRVCLAPGLEPASIPVGDELADVAHVSEAAWDAPVPRVPTETVVLLR